MMVTFSNFSYNLTYNHLRILELLELNKIDDTAFRGIFNDKNFEQLILSLYELKEERDEIAHLINQILLVAKEEQDDMEPFEGEGILGVDGATDVTEAMLKLSGEKFEAQRCFNELVECAREHGRCAGRIW